MTGEAGYRTRKRQQLNKERKRGRTWPWTVMAIAVLVVIFGLLGGVVKVAPIDTAWRKTVGGFGWLGHQVKSLWPFRSSPGVASFSFMPKGRKTANYLIAVTKQAGGATYLSTLLLVSSDSRSKTASMVFIPNDLLVATPGMGSDLVSNLVELDGGRIDAGRVTVENLLGVKTDRYVLASDRDLRLILKQLGDRFTIAVPSRLSYKDPGLEINLDLKPGTRTVDATTLASYLTYGQPGKSMDLAKRQADFAPRLVSMIGATDVDSFMAKNAKLFDTDVSSRELAGLVKTLSSLKGGGLDTVVLPVKEFRYEKTVVNRVDAEVLPGFVKRYMKTESPVTGRRIKVEVLNGCGVPGIGGKVSSRIDLTKFQVVNSANADSFDNPETLVVVYSDDKDVINAANELRDELEAGRVVSQPQAQSLSEISVVVGKDYASK